MADPVSLVFDAVGLGDQCRRVAAQLDAVLRRAGERAGIPADERRERVF